MYFLFYVLGCKTGGGIFESKLHLKIEGSFQYLYNIGTGLNDYIVDRPKQMAIDNKVRSQKIYECCKPFDEKMNKLK